MPHADRAAARAYASKHYQENKQAYKARALAFNKKTRIENRKRIQAWLATHPCVDCGEADPIVLEFDHVRGTKKSNIADMITSLHSWPRIAEEINKCEVRCANCHRRKTHRERLALTPTATTC